MTSPAPLTVAVFPGAANAPLYAAAQNGEFSRRGLDDVQVVEVRSSTEQMRLWDEGACDVMHTSADHLLREERPREPVIARRDGFGELAVYRRSEATDLRSVTWAVDAVSSGFAFVMRALLAERAGLAAGDQRLEPVGGTLQRFEALLDPTSGIGGTTLHPPFDRLAAAAGMTRIAGHLDLWPEMLTQVTVAPRASVRSGPIASYLDALDSAAERLAAGGVAEIETVLAAKGLARAAARAGAEGLLGGGGLGEARRPSLAGLRAVAELRASFVPGWSPPRSLERLLLAPAEANA
jgi:hypothetical protein